MLANPWSGRDFVENLRPDILAVASELGRKLMPIILKAWGGADRVEAYGRAAKRGGPAVRFSFRMMHKLDKAMRSHY